MRGTAREERGYPPVLREPRNDIGDAAHSLAVFNFEQTRRSSKLYFLCV